MFDLESVRKKVASELPDKYEPLLLTFYGMQSTLAEDSIIFGDDYGTKLHLDVRTGAVRSIDDAGRHPTRFVNSSLAQLSASLSEYERVRLARSSELSADELRASAKSFRDRLQSIDAGSVEDAENWWSTVVEQMEDGLL